MKSIIVAYFLSRSCVGRKKRFIVKTLIWVLFNLFDWFFSLTFILYAYFIFHQGTFSSILVHSFLHTHPPPPPTENVCSSTKNCRGMILTIWLDRTHHSPGLLWLVQNHVFIPIRIWETYFIPLGEVHSVSFHPRVYVSTQQSKYEYERLKW